MKNNTCRRKWLHLVDTNKTFAKIITAEDYPYLNTYTHPVKRATRQILGREKQMREIMASFARPELSNVILLAEAGGGKTALVQGLMVQDEKRIYLEVQLSRMVADAKDHPDSIAEWLRDMFNEASKFGKESSSEIVLFIDEFHQIVQLSAAAVEVMKPLLADSGTRGIRVIAATTFEEFRKYISSNLPLVERFQRIQLPQPEENVIISILTNMAKRYGVYNDIDNPEHLFKLIYEYTNRYIPSQIQPRKSILVLDDMIGYHRALDYKMDKKLIAQVLYDQQGVNVNFAADPAHIEDYLNKHVIQQTIATAAITRRLQICIADLNDKTKPMASMLFTGSTGVGKTEMVKQMTKLLMNDTQQLIRFDMTEYAEETSLERFRNELTAQVWAHPYCVILLDEIEKACSPVTRILLQVLDDGRLSDENNRTVSFINCYIVMTTNAASEIYKTVQNYQNDTSDKDFMNKYDDLIRTSIQQTTGANRFPPELLGRIDTIVPFRPLSEGTKRTITAMHLNSLSREVMLKHNTKCNISKKVIEYLVKDQLRVDNSDAGGARTIIHKLEAEVTTPVAAFVNTHPKIHNIVVTVLGSMTSENKNQLISRAYIKVFSMAGYKRYRKEHPEAFKNNIPTDAQQAQRIKEIRKQPAIQNQAKQSVQQQNNGNSIQEPVLTTANTANQNSQNRQHKPVRHGIQMPTKR